MKFKFIIFLILLNSVNLYPQANGEIDVVIENISTTKAIFLYPSIGFNSSKIKIQGGMLIGNEYVNSNTILGGQIDFMFFPNERDIKLFNFYFIANINYFNNPQRFNTSLVKNSIYQITLGYGFEYFLSKSIFLKSNIGLGGMVEKRKFNFDTNDPINKYGFAGSVSFGLGYRL